MLIRPKTETIKSNGLRHTSLFLGKDCSSTTARIKGREKMSTTDTTADTQAKQYIFMSRDLQCWFPNNCSIKRWKMFGALQSPNSIRVHTNNPKGAQKAVLGLSLLVTGTLYIHRPSQWWKTNRPLSRSPMTSICLCN